MLFPNANSGGTCVVVEFKTKVPPLILGDLEYAVKKYFHTQLPFAVFLLLLLSWLVFLIILQDTVITPLPPLQRRKQTPREETELAQVTQS